MNGCELIAAERKRQTDEEGWDREHDDLHESGELAIAAACYATPAVRQRVRMRTLVLHATTRDPATRTRVPVPVLWPWEAEWWKPEPENRIRELVKAGALIAAEIDRLQRDGMLSSPPGTGGQAEGGPT